MYSNTVYLQYSNLKDYQWVRCTHNTLAQGSSKDCTTFGLERFRALSDNSLAKPTYRYQKKSRNSFFGSDLIQTIFFEETSTLVSGSCTIKSGQIIATSHDLTPNGGLVREIPLFQGNLGW